MKVKALLVLVLVIAFVSSCEVPSEPDPSIPQLVFQDEFNDYWPSLSPDGRYLAFLSDRDGEYPDFQCLLCLYDFETKEISVLTVYYSNDQSNFVRQVEWSVDGQWLFFFREYENYAGIWNQLCRIPLGGSDEDIEVLKENTSRFNVHPDGEKLVVYYRAYPEESLIAELDIATSEFTIVENTTGILCYSLAYTPDGTAIMASIRTDDAPQYDSDVVIFPLDGSEPEGFEYEYNQYQSEHERISFSPDGRYCLLQGGGLFSVKMESGETDILLRYEFNTDDAGWANDGFVYFSSYADGYQDSIWRFKP